MDTFGVLGVFRLKYDFLYHSIFIKVIVVKGTLSKMKGRRENENKI